MKIPYITLLASALLQTGYAQGQQASNRFMLLNYPQTKKVPVTDRYFDTVINDPYRWLENDSAAQTKQWANEQHLFTQQYLLQIPIRDTIRRYLTTAWNYPKETPPVKVGAWYLFSKNNGLQNQSIWFIKKGVQGKEEELLDPNKLSPGGTAAVTMLAPSANKKYIAYAVAKAGSDWNTIYIMDLARRERLKDQITGIQFPRTAWKGNGFYYVRYAAPVKDTGSTATTTRCQVYYHRLGDEQRADRLVYEDKTNPHLSLGVFVTEDERFLVISALPGSFLGFKLTTSTGNALLYRDLSIPGSSIKTLVKDYTYHNTIVDNRGDTLLLQTDADAPNGRLVLVDTKHPEPANWQTIIPGQKESIENIDTGGGYVWVSYLKDARSLISQYTHDGKKIRDVALPGIGTAANFAAGKYDTALFYTFVNFTTPLTIYGYNIANGQSVLYRKPTAGVNTEEYTIKQVFCPSKDGTKIPVFIVHKKGVTPNGSNPVFLLGHGGFKRNLTPFFNPAISMFIQNGGVYAQACLRGGNEYGEAWHKGGMRQNKQNVFDDFIAVTEYLISEQYTNASKIAIGGQSTGAILVAACINQRPDLYKVALPAVGAMDMLRYQKFTIGSTWAEEYGTSDQEEQFKYLVKYSPLHNIKAGITYPATLIITADHDNTVVPAHSYKYAATLQERQQGDNPVLIRIDHQTGHGPGKPTSKQIEEAVDVWSFVFHHLQMNWKL